MVNYKFFPIFIGITLLITITPGTATSTYTASIFESGRPFAPTVLGIVRDSSDRWHVIESSGSIVHKWRDGTGALQVETIENDSLITYSIVDLGNGIGLFYKGDHVFHYWFWVDGVSQKISFQSALVDPINFGFSAVYQVFQDGQDIFLYLTDNPARFGFDKPFLYIARIGEDFSFSEEIEFFDDGGFFISDFFVYQNTTYFLFESLEENNGTYVRKLKISDGQTDLYLSSENTSIVPPIEDFVVLNSTDFVIVYENRLILVHRGEMVYEKVLKDENEGQSKGYQSFIDGTFYFVTNLLDEELHLTSTIYAWAPHEKKVQYEFKFETDGHLVRIDYIDGQPVFFFELPPSNEDLLVLKDPSIRSILKVAHPFDDFPSFFEPPEETQSTNDKASTIGLTLAFAGVPIYSLTRRRRAF